MTDDQGWGDTGYNDHPHLKTPHLDQMQAEGVTFTRFYSGAAMCSPTRGSCYTGRNPYRYGITFAMAGMLEPTEVPITSVLKKQGYTTGHFGKWHLGTLSKEKGDQKRWGTFAKATRALLLSRPGYATSMSPSSPSPRSPPGTPSSTPARSQKEKIRRRQSQQRPYGNDYFTGPGTTVSRKYQRRRLPRHHGPRPSLHSRRHRKESPPSLPPSGFTPRTPPSSAGQNIAKLYHDQPEHAQHYYACLTAMDEQIGRLRAELKSLGIADNTMICFCSDNGPARQGSPRHVGTARNLKGYKLSLNEGGIRVPGLMVWPAKIKEPRTVTTPCFTSDYFTTILAALEVPPPRRPHLRRRRHPPLRHRQADRA